jgi:hypothetical protein
MCYIPYIFFICLDWEDAQFGAFVGGLARNFPRAALAIVTTVDKVGRILDILKAQNLQMHDVVSNF